MPFLYRDWNYRNDSVRFLDLRNVNHINKNKFFFIFVSHFFKATKVSNFFVLVRKFFTNF